MSRNLFVCQPLIVLLALVACTSNITPPAMQIAPTPEPTLEPMPTLAPTAVSKPPAAIETVSLTTDDNVTLSATLFGQGKLAVILAHQGTEGTDQKSWQPFAEVLAEKGNAALTLDFRGRGQSKGYLQASQLIKDLNAAIQFLRGRGYQRIVCMGASMGGTACLRAALDHDLAGLVVIASPIFPASDLNSDASPFQFVSSRTICPSRPPRQPLANCVTAPCDRRNS